MPWRYRLFGVISTLQRPIHSAFFHPDSHHDPREDGTNGSTAQGVGVLVAPSLDLNPQFTLSQALFGVLNLQRQSVLAFGNVGIFELEPLLRNAGVLGQA